MTGHVSDAKGTVTLHAPQGWTLSPSEQAVALDRPGEPQLFAFNLSPTAAMESGEVTASLQIAGATLDVDVRKIDYPHIPLQTLFPKRRRWLYAPMRSRCLSALAM